MRFIRRLFLFVSVACIGVSILHAQSPSTSAGSSTPAATVDLERERGMLRESRDLRTKGDFAAARERAAAAAKLLLERPQADQDNAWLDLLTSAGRLAFSTQDFQTARIAGERVLAMRTASQLDDADELQNARLDVALSLVQLGELSAAKPLLEKVFEVRTRTLPDDHPELQRARQNLAVVIKELGDIAGARPLEEKVLEVRTRILPDDHPELQRSRNNLAVTLYQLGDIAGAKRLQQQVLDALSRTLPNDHHELQRARQNLAVTIRALGDAAGARVLEEAILEVQSRVHPPDHQDVQRARMNLAATLVSLGDYATARPLLEQVVEVYARTMPADYSDLQLARHNLANALYELGDLAGARALDELVLEIRSRTMPDDHPYLQIARQSLARTLYALGDFETAKALFEKSFDVGSRTLPEDHPELQRMRANLASLMIQVGDVTAAKAMSERALESFSRTRSQDDRDLQLARSSVAEALIALGDLAGARSMFEQVLDVSSRTLPEGHPSLQRTRRNLATTIARQSAGEQSTPAHAGGHADGADHVGAEQGSDAEPAGDIEHASDAARARQACAMLIREFCRAQVQSARAAIVGSPRREAEERCTSLAKALDETLSFAQGYGVWDRLPDLESDAFELSETTRGAALIAAEMTRTVESTTRAGALRDALREASSTLAFLAQKGTTSAEFDRARAEREAMERELIAEVHALPSGIARGVDLDVAELGRRLDRHTTAVAFRRFVKQSFAARGERETQANTPPQYTEADSLCAFVVRRAESGDEREAGSLLTLVDLGPIAPIETLVRDWREALGVASETRGLSAALQVDESADARARGSALRRLVFDPLIPVLGDADHLVLALDDVLHVVPIDSLPWDDGSLVGNHWRIETRATLTELARDSRAPSKAGALILFGDVDYDATLASAGAVVAKVERASEPSAGESRETDGASVLRGTAWAHGFTALSGTGVEVRGIASCFADRFGVEAEPQLCVQASATRERFFELAPKARYLHVATHGWFARESIRSWSDEGPLDKQSGLGARMSGVEQVKGMSPMLLCGLALAGANLPATAIGRAPGLVTAEELSTLDLTSCELVVLSACDTNVGEKRAGQGVASLQKALQMAGARSVITSLWKVPDEATKDLMLDFYRRMWVEEKPKHQALWEAKTKLREAKDERGALKYTTRDWAAWVLTGAPD